MEDSTETWREEHYPLLRGHTQFIKFKNGETLTRTEAMKAKCYECMGYFLDGAMDCEVKTCPMYQYMPYKNHDRGSDTG